MNLIIQLIASSILFTSDHGDMQGDHYHWRKTYPYEGSAHVPLILSWPEGFPGATIPRGSITDVVAELRDLFPTFLSAAGLEPAYAVDGESLTCLLSDTSGCRFKLIWIVVFSTLFAMSVARRRLY